MSAENMAVQNETTRVSEEKSSNNSDIVVNQLDGAADLVKLPPVFSKDAKYLFIASGCNVRVYSTQSSSQTIVLQGHEKNVVGIETLPDGDGIRSMDTSGKVITWNYVTGAIENEYKMDFGSGFVRSFHQFMGETYILCSAEENDVLGDVYHVQPNRNPRKLFRTSVNIGPNKVALGCSSVHQGIIAVLGNDHVLVKDLRAGQEKKHMTDSRSFTCVTLHPSEVVMATGDLSGRVQVWYDFLKHNRPPKTVYHWHTLPVSTVCFSTEGSYFFSGGAENTLVKWNTKNNSRSFLPRMGSPIVHIVNSPDNIYVATSHADNAIRLVDKTNKIHRSILGLVKHNGQRVLPAGLEYDPRSKGVYLNGLVGHLQLLDVANESLMFNLDITSRNVITDERTGAAGNVDVTKIAISQDGHWLATVEAWSQLDKPMAQEVQMKFWKFDETLQNFALNTSVTMPHDGEVTGVAFQPGQDDPCFVSVSSDDKKFKIWRLLDEDDVYSKQNRSSWFCDSVGDFRELQPRSVAFSEDGSLLAISFDSVVTVWDPFVVQLKTTLAHSLVDEPIEYCLFGREQCCHLLVCGTRNTVFAWNVLTLSLSWTVKLPASLVALTGDVKSVYMAAVLENSDVIVFSPASSKPVHLGRKICRASPLSAVFVPRFNPLKQAPDWLRESRLLLVDRDQEMYSLDDARGERYEPRRQNNLVENLPFTPFAALKAQQRIVHAQDVAPIVHATQGIKGFSSIQSLLENPASTLPPMTRLCEPFLASLLLKHEKTENSKQVSRTIEDKMGSLELSPKKTKKQPALYYEEDFTWVLTPK